MITARPAAPITRMDPYEYYDSSTNLQLDLDLNRFLETDLALHEIDNDTTAPDALSDEMLFTDISNSIDIPDLDFGDNNQVSADVDTKPSTAAIAEATEAETTQTTPSLLVVIPASALNPPSSSDPQSKPQTAKLTWSQIWSKRQKAVKDELLNLHHQVIRLESKLERLRQNARAPTEFEQILKLEIEEKQKSEAENAKLKQMLERELKTTRRLSKLLRKCQELSVDDIID